MEFSARRCHSAGKGTFGSTKGRPGQSKRSPSNRPPPMTAPSRCRSQPSPAKRSQAGGWPGSKPSWSRARKSLRRRRPGDVARYPAPRVSASKAAGRPRRLLWCAPLRDGVHVRGHRADRNTKRPIEARGCGHGVFKRMDATGIDRPSLPPGIGAVGLRVQLRPRRVRRRCSGRPCAVHRPPWLR